MQPENPIASIQQHPGDGVAKGDEVGRIYDLIQFAPLDGIIRGVTHDNVLVA